MTGANWITTDQVLSRLRGGDVTLSTPKGMYTAMVRCPTLYTSILKRTSSLATGKVEVNKGEAMEYKINSQQTLLSFITSIELALCVFGRAYVRSISIIGFEGEKSFELLDNTQLTENRINGVLTDYTYTTNSTYQRILPDEVMTLDDVEGISLFNQGYPVTRMMAIEGDIKCTALSSEVCVDLITNRGALGVLSMVSVTDPLGKNTQTKEERDSIYKRFTAAYGILTGKMKFVISHLNSKFTKISADIKEMGLSEMSVRNKERITEQYGVPRILLGMADSTFSNLAEAKEFFYNSEIQPRAERIAAFLSEVMGVEVKIYYDHLGIFQSAKKTYAEAMGALVDYYDKATASELLTQDEALREFNEKRT